VDNRIVGFMTLSWLIIPIIWGSHFDGLECPNFPSHRYDRDEGDRIETGKSLSPGEDRNAQ